MPELIDVEPGSPEWLAARRAGVTATDIVTILGLSSWDSVYSLFWRKLGQVPEMEDRDRFRLGRYLEDYVFDRWLEQSREFRVQFQESALYRHSEREWQLATLDRRGRTCVVELKSWADADRRTWGQGQVYDDDKTLLVHDDQVPPQVRAQVLWQMDTMDADMGHVGVAFLPSGEFRSFEIGHENGCTGVGNKLSYPSLDCSICDDQVLMREAGEEFMRRLRLELPSPDPDSSAATLAAVRARFARQPAKQAEVSASLWNAWYGAKQEAETWADLVRKYEIQLREQAGEAGELCVDGQVVARRVVVDAHVRAHVRHQDYIRRVKQQEDDDE